MHILFLFLFLDNLKTVGGVWDTTI